ncbi:MAG: hypothetical protein NC048_04820 [Bacteroides sp.]|nr:hypothetical protein [Ruminococcus flavefaciens]MCM1554799.1 hypothetical protein [Bacteroides sp.]
MKKSWMILLAVVLTMLFAVFQRMSGPTNPKSGKVEVNGHKYAYKMPRSGTTGEETTVKFPNIIDNTSGASTQAASQGAFLFYRRYPLVEGEEYTMVPMRWQDGSWTASLPSRPMAGKWAYYLQVEGRDFFADSPVVIRYRGMVPAGILIPHILLMFLAMFFAVMAGLNAALNRPGYRLHCLLTLLCLLLGGFVFGCMVQYRAFGVYWSGFPLGNDFTDNKTLIALLAFLAAWGVMVFRKQARWAVLAASIVMLGIFCVPHSTNGSELSNETGRVESAR